MLKYMQIRAQLASLEAPMARREFFGVLFYFIFVFYVFNQTTLSCISVSIVYLAQSVS